MNNETSQEHSNITTEKNQLQTEIIILKKKINPKNKENRKYIWRFLKNRLFF